MQYGVECARTSAPGRRLHPAASLQTSPFLMAMPPFHEPPMVNARPSDSSVLACDTACHSCSDLRPCRHGYPLLIRSRARGEHTRQLHDAATTNGIATTDPGTDTLPRNSYSRKEATAAFASHTGVRQICKTARSKTRAHRTLASGITYSLMSRPALRDEGSVQSGR